MPPCRVLARSLISVGRSARSSAVVDVLNNRRLVFAFYFALFFVWSCSKNVLVALVVRAPICGARCHLFFLMSFVCLLVVDQVDKELKEGVANAFFKAVEADKRKASLPCTRCG